MSLKTKRMQKILDPIEIQVKKNHDFIFNYLNIYLRIYSSDTCKILLNVQTVFSCLFFFFL